MPTKREREYYKLGFIDGADYQKEQSGPPDRIERDPGGRTLTYRDVGQPKKRKLSAWNKYVKANSKKPRFVLRSGKLNLKKMGVAFRKPAINPPITTGTFSLAKNVFIFSCILYLDKASRSRAVNF